jgi:hypothetical protein
VGENGSQRGIISLAKVGGVVLSIWWMRGWEWILIWRRGVGKRRRPGCRFFVDCVLEGGSGIASLGAERIILGM